MDKKQFIIDNVHILDKHDENKLFEFVWKNRFNKIGSFYINTSDNTDKVCLYREQIRVNFNNTPEEEHDKIMQQVLQSYGDMETYYLFKEFSSIYITKKDKGYRIASEYKYKYFDILAYILDVKGEAKQELEKKLIGPYGGPRFNTIPEVTFKIFEYTDGAIKISGLSTEQLSRLEKLISIIEKRHTYV